MLHSPGPQLTLPQHSYQNNFSEECALVAQLWQILCDPMDCSPLGFSDHEIFQARILEWVAISFSGDLPNPGIEPGSPALQADSLPTELQGNSGLEASSSSLWPIFLSLLAS